MQTTIRRRSKKRAKQEREYKEVRDMFLLDNPICVPHGDISPIDIYTFGEIEATTVHHKKGRIGSLLTDSRYFLACCMECHEFIERNPRWAKEHGYSLSRLSKTIA